MHFLLSGLALILLSPLGASLAHAAACCGAGSVAPTIISGDDTAQISISAAHSSVIGDAPVSGLPVFRADSDNERTQTLRVEGAVLLGDRWQAGASLPLTRRTRETSQQSAAATGIGDIGVDLAYEILPEWDYSVWRPRGFAFVHALIPTGGSIYDVTASAADPWLLNARGRGFFMLGAGGLFVKSWGNWDAVAVTELHHALPRTFNTDVGSLNITPGWGGSIALGGGYSLDAFPVRFGLTLSPSIEGGISTQESSSGIRSQSSSQIVWNTSLQCSWMPTSLVSVSANYTDQTLLGPASNVALSRTVSLLLQKRWDR